MTHSDAPLDELRILIQPSPETNDHEVRLLSDGEDLLDRFSDGMIGLDPGDILVDPCPLLANEIPRTVTIGRCDCGFVGCGSIAVTIALGEGVVTWTTPDRPVGRWLWRKQFADPLCTPLWNALITNALDGALPPHLEQLAQRLRSNEDAVPGAPRGAGCD